MDALEGKSKDTLESCRKVVDFDSGMSGEEVDTLHQGQVLESVKLKKRQGKESSHCSIPSR
jgi:hypothetical protein